MKRIERLRYWKLGTLEFDDCEDAYTLTHDPVVFRLYDNVYWEAS